MIDFCAPHIKEVCGDINCLDLFSQRGQQDASQLRNGETQHFGLRFNSSLRAEVSEMWNFVLSALISEFEYLRENHVPPILIHLTLKQSLAFLNMKVFNR